MKVKFIVMFMSVLLMLTACTGGGKKTDGEGKITESEKTTELNKDTGDKDSECKQEYTLNDLSFKISDKWKQNIENSDSTKYWFESGEDKDRLIVHYDVVPDIMKIDVGTDDVIKSESDVVDKFATFSSLDTDMIDKKETVEFSGYRAYKCSFTSGDGKFGKELFVPINETEKYLEFILMVEDKSNLNEFDEILDSSNLAEVLKNSADGQDGESLESNNEETGIFTKTSEEFAEYIEGELENNGSRGSISNPTGTETFTCKILYDYETIGSIGADKLDGDIPKQYIITFANSKEVHDDLEVMVVIYAMMAADSSLSQRDAIDIYGNLLENIKGTSSYEKNGVQYKGGLMMVGTNQVLMITITDQTKL